jgi:hypothetical protein
VCFAPYLIHRAAPGTRKQKIGLYCNFFAIRGCRMVPPRRKSAVHHSCTGSLSPCQSGKGSLIEKKLQKCPIFCLCNGRITETRQIRNKYLASAELGPENQTEVKRRARRATVLSICGGTRLRQCRTSGAAAYPGRLSNSTQIAPMGQNEPIKRKGHRAK